MRNVVYLKAGSRALTALLLIALIMPVVGVSADSHGPVIIHVDAKAMGNDNGTSWEDAFASLQDALTHADSIERPVQVWVARGIYRPHETDRSASFELRDNVEIYGGFDGSESDVRLRDWRANRTTLSGNLGQRGNDDENSYTVVLSIQNDDSAILDGFVVSGGNSNAGAGAPASQQFGGGLYLQGSRAVLRNLRIVRNQSSNSGGGISVQTFSSPTLVNLAVSGNRARSGAGFSISFSGATVVNTVVTGNRAETHGGGLLADSSSPLLVNLTVSGNRAFSGGGGVSLLDSNARFFNSIIWGNAAPDQPELRMAYATQPLINHAIVGGGCPARANHCQSVDPLFLNPSDPAGAPTLGGRYSLTRDSPAIDAGSNDLLPASLLHDLDGNPRIVNDVVDLGAYEWTRDPARVPQSEEPDLTPLEEISNLHVWRAWARTDLPVRDGHVSRTWMWGPGPFTQSIWEPYAESPGDLREMGYFDKNPHGDQPSGRRQRLDLVRDQRAAGGRDVYRQPAVRR